MTLDEYEEVRSKADLIPAIFAVCVIETIDVESNECFVDEAVAEEEGAEEESSFEGRHIFPCV